MLRRAILPDKSPPGKTDETGDRIAIHDELVFAEHLRAQDDGTHEVEGAKHYGDEKLEIVVMGKKCHRYERKTQSEEHEKNKCNGQEYQLR